MNPQICQQSQGYAIAAPTLSAGQAIIRIKDRYAELQAKLDEVPAIRAELAVLSRLIEAAELGT